MSQRVADGAYLSARDAPEAREAGSQASSPQEVTELLLDEARKPIAVPQRAGGARNVSKWSRTIPYRMVDVRSRGWYAHAARRQHDRDAQWGTRTPRDDHLADLA